MTPAEIIRSQLGTGTLFMIGAKSLLSFDEGKGLRFKIGRNAKGVGLVEIHLDPDDTYTVKFSKVRCKKGEVVPTITVLSEFPGVYVESLHATIERCTGLVTRFPAIVRSA